MTQPSPRLAARTALARIGTSLLSLLCVSAWCQEPPKKPLMSVEEAILALDSPNAQVQYEAAFALAKSGAKAKPAVPTIVEILNRGGEDVRPDLLWVLVALGPDAQEAVPALIKTAESPNFHARYITASRVGPNRARRSAGSSGPAEDARGRRHVRASARRRSARELGTQRGS